jgi:hypothetical protein
MDRRVERGRVDRIVRVEEPEPHFKLRDDVGSVLARARHVLLALGHARWAWPAAVEDGALREALAGILYHAYQPKPPDAGSVLVIGSGLAAATEWMNALASGGHVVALRRKPSLLLQALSAPRCAFAGPWLDRYHSLDADSRLAALADISQGSFPRTWTAQRLLRRAEREGRLVMRIGDLSGLERTGDGRAVATVRAADGSVEQMEIDRVLAATGFSAAAAEYGVVRRAIEEYSLATRGGFLVLSDDCLVPALSREGSVLAVSGPLARWAFPAGDSFAGLKYAARRFAARVLARGLGGPGSVPAWLRMVHAGWPRRTGRVEDEVCATP